jgi:hypothetical protein|tara:strand:+ start:1157 stop:1564 length:408 start_codon:yes stop_codon:yes gene_type:complete
MQCPKMHLGEFLVYIFHAWKLEYKQPSKAKTILREALEVMITCHITFTNGLKAQHFNEYFDKISSNATLVEFKPTTAADRSRAVREAVVGCGELLGPGGANIPKLEMVKWLVHARVRPQWALVYQILSQSGAFGV